MGFSYASTALLVAFGLLSKAAASELSVAVYEGPKECEDSEKAKVGDVLQMHYTGKIDESSATGVKGHQFDSSRDRGQPFEFEIGQGRVIRGWEEGIAGLCKGAKVRIYYSFGCIVFCILLEDFVAKNSFYKQCSRIFNFISCLI
jgi:hypothetical protein